MLYAARWNTPSDEYLKKFSIAIVRRRASFCRNAAFNHGGLNERLSRPYGIRAGLLHFFGTVLLVQDVCKKKVF